VVVRGRRGAGTQWDTYERLRREDLIVVATIICETANRAELLPRKPVPNWTLPLSGGLKPAAPLDSHACRGGAAGFTPPEKTQADFFLRLPLR